MRAASGALWAALLSCGLCGPAAADMVANTSVRPPYQFLHEGELTGTTIDTLRCIQQAQAAHWDIVLVPWARAAQF
jgi:polar amino acid transport system substrate-binding protein